MAISAPTQRGIAEPIGQLGTTVVTPGTTCAAGTLAVLTCTANSVKLFSSVVDSVGNTWTVDKTVSDGTRTINFASCQVVTPITSANTITITWSTATSGTIVIWLHEVTNAATSSAFDTFNSGTGTGTALATGSTAVLALADELVFGCFRSTAAAPVWTKGASYSNPTTPTSSTTIGSFLEYQIVAATTAVLADGTTSTSGTWVGLCVTYKGVSGAAPTISNLGLLGVGT